MTLIFNRLIYRPNCACSACE